MTRYTRRHPVPRREKCQYCYHKKRPFERLVIERVKYRERLWGKATHRVRRICLPCWERLIAPNLLTTGTGQTLCSNAGTPSSILGGCRQ